MRDVIDDIGRWQAAGEPVALATVIETWGSAPRRVGAKMAMSAAGQIAGSVSGGCVEGAVAAVGEEVLVTGEAHLLSFGVADETAWDVGLACGGRIQVFVQTLSAERFRRLAAELAADRPVATATIIAGAASDLGRSLAITPTGILDHDLRPELLPAVHEAARRALAAAVSGRRTAAEVGLELFVDVQLPRPALVMVGGVHIAIALARLASVLGYHTIVVDPRRAFGSEDRFAHADRLIQAWPNRAFDEITVTANTAVAMLTHDPKIDDPALLHVLSSPAFYVGALGSQSTQAKRRDRMRAAGLTEEQIARIRGPIGLPIGAETPEEIAVAILAEIVQARHAGNR